MPDITVVNIDKLEMTMKTLMKEYGSEVAAAYKKSVDQVAKKAVRDLKTSSPKGKGGGGRLGHYKDNWKSKIETNRLGSTNCVIYNKNKPGLVHLLEFEHEKVGPDNVSHGYSKPKPHVKDVRDWVESEIPKQLTKTLQAGGK